MGAKRPAKRRHPWLRRIGLVVLAIMAGLLLSIIAFRFVNPPITPVMVAEKLRGTTLKHRWVPLDSIARDLPLAVIASEDGRFCNPLGRRLGGGEGRGRGGGKRRHAASAARAPSPCRRRRTSISAPTGAMCGRFSKCRSLICSPCFWPKERVIEVYLNIAQWGPGIFGAEAASQQYFHKSAARSSRGGRRLLLAAALPNPLLRNPGKPSPQNAADRQVGRAEDADSRHALGLRRPADQPPIGLWPAPGLATITALTQEPRGHPADIFEGWIMAVPKRKTSRMKRGNRRSHDALGAPTYVEDKEFGRAPPAASYRSQVRQISGPPGAQGQGRGLRRAAVGELLA